LIGGFCNSARHPATSVIDKWPCIGECRGLQEPPTHLCLTGSSDFLGPVDLASACPAGAILLKACQPLLRSVRHPDQFPCDIRLPVSNAGVTNIVMLELAGFVCLYRPPWSTVVMQLHDLLANRTRPRRHYRSPPLWWPRPLGG